VTIMLTPALSECGPRHTDRFIFRPPGFRTGALNYVNTATKCYSVYPLSTLGQWVFNMFAYYKSIWRIKLEYQSPTLSDDNMTLRTTFWRNNLEHQRRHNIENVYD